ncbi:unnamed protein product [Chilo suppressalis]|uniref:Uncharacterized protein n=1 Tax=Chilo suppressalis TaxID=168631 RepID=A0ABN8B337_CHISP|nr:unnamed protein product [Chilo suppressalis]
MPLTNAEKQKRYRERLKQNPEKYEEQKKKNLERIKSKYSYKKISEMTDREKADTRKKWRDQKRKYTKHEKSKQTDCTTKNITDVVADTPTTSHTSNNVQPIIKRLQRSRAMYKKVYEAAESRIVTLMRQNETLRKKLYRFKEKQKTNQDTLQLKIDKLTARNELLESALKNAYKNCKNNEERNLLKSIAVQESIQEKKGTFYIISKLGLKGGARKKCEKMKLLKMKKQIEDFFLRDDITRATSGKRECITRNKCKKQRRYQNDTLKNLYEIFKQEGGSGSFSTFCKFKPFYILSPSINKRNTCLCVKHSNIDFKCNALRRNNVMLHNNSYEVLKAIVCDIRSYQCMYGTCNNCKNKKINYNLDNLTAEIQWQMWETTVHSFTKRTDQGDKTVKTKKTIKAIKNGTINYLVEIFKADLEKFKVHSYNNWHQIDQYNKLKDNIGNDAVVIHCDFSENFDCKLAAEVQSMHFGASKTQVTLHTGVVYYKSEKQSKQSFCTISPSNIHQPDAIWAHLKPVIQLAKSLVPNLKKIHFYSDGPSSQYRQKNNFILIKYFASLFHIDITWSFFESGHGKGVADAIGGVVKRALDRDVAYGKDIVNAADVYASLKKNVPSVKYFYINDSDINEVRILIPASIKTIRGTMLIHEIIALKSNDRTIYHRILSCFCTGLICQCFDLKTHRFERNCDELFCNMDITSNENMVSEVGASDVSELTEQDHLEHNMNENNCTLPTDASNNINQTETTLDDLITAQRDYNVPLVPENQDHAVDISDENVGFEIVVSDAIINKAISMFSTNTSSTVATNTIFEPTSENMQNNSLLVTSKGEENENKENRHTERTKNSSHCQAKWGYYWTMISISSCRKKIFVCF